MLVADADVPGPVLQKLRAIDFPIVSFREIGAPVRPDSALIEHMLSSSDHRVLVTLDKGIPSQRYVAQFCERGLTVVLLRWKTSTTRDFEEMVSRILSDGDRWEQAAAEFPHVISANRHRSRYRQVGDIPFLNPTSPATEPPSPEDAIDS